jgi:hypothetical protein
MDTPLPPLPPPVPFGEPAPFRQENRSVVGRGVLFGCGGCLVVVLAGVGLVVGIFALVSGSIRNSDVCTQAMARAAASAEVRALLGTPLTQGWMISGSINLNGSNGDADVTFPISGPKGGGSVHAEAKKKNGAWIFTTLTVTPDQTGKEIDLLAPTSFTWRRALAAPPA